ncbi:proliferating cell nuclear antigen, putative [Entamoeba invadens IP1]|uniref:DNA sliding clamp PCNA n=1 Tax=Entamoeba invadens IP1 TaxID=370355 RepID=A0A0A1UFC0_ENTIV|nr:proliferating cell nuclear antigen, putative [Entamoeba invadens IP1]ELP95183.1 proliferating cell nuclear antigen, putative [Entamoeba invadens IP1]|eukprot:XP_004261954.1 proliferating cell nuclear antigen, putative [Entamoeba invadens IP1]
MAFNGKFKEASLLKRIVDALKSTIDKVNFDCSDAGIAVQCMDNSHVSLVSLLIQTDAFEEYNCAQTFTMGINLTHLSKILKAIDNESTLTLSVKDKKDAVLKITSENGNKVIEFGLNLINIEEESVEIPELETGAKVTMLSADFLRITKDFSALGDESVSIGANKTEVIFKSSGAMCETSMVLKKDEAVDANTLEIECKQEVAASFALKQIAEFAKSASLADKVALYIRADSPITIEFMGEGCELKFYLAPKFDEGQPEAQE